MPGRCAFGRESRPSTEQVFQAFAFMSTPTLASRMVVGTRRRPRPAPPGSIAGPAQEGWIAVAWRIVCGLTHPVRRAGAGPPPCSRFDRGRRVAGHAEGLPRGLPLTLPSARLAAFPDPLGSGAGARSSGVEQPTFEWEPRRETSGWKGVKFGEPLRWRGNPEPSPSTRGRCRD